jgi:pimeloyl-ACP methyl ester carboxylesterase
MATTSAKRPAPKPEPKAQREVLEVVDPRWLLKALGLTIGAAAILSYLSLCLLIYQGSWQLILHPSAKIDATPTAAFQAVRFDAAATGTPRLTGWWIPADSPAARTILFLHDGSGSLSAAAPKLDLLHTTGVNVFAFDYRGFGQSNGPHPTESRLAEDAAAALDYLVNTRHIPETQIVPYGEGLGTVLAANLAGSHGELPAVILDNPDPMAFTRATTGAKFALLPMRTLMQEHFDITTTLKTLQTPKLLLADGPNGFDSARVAANQSLFRSAPDPKMAVTFDDRASIYPQHIPARDAYVAAVNRFLDEYVH